MNVTPTETRPTIAALVAAVTETTARVAAAQHDVDHAEAGWPKQLACGTLRRAQAAHAIADAALRAALDPFAKVTNPEATPEEWRAEQARLLAAGETQRSHGCGWIAWDLETRRARISPTDVRWGGTGPREITRYGERIVGPEAW